MCNTEKTRSEFYFNPTGKDGHQSKCIPCSKKMNRIYYLQRKEKPKETLLPFIYHPRVPTVEPPDPQNLTIQRTKVTLDFP
jgi:uncharacterized Zn-finger protein